MSKKDMRDPGRSDTDWEALKKKTSDEIRRAVEEDPDGRSLGPKELKEFRRLSPVKRLRLRLGLTQQKFAEAFSLNLSTLRDWEQGRAAPDQATEAYLQVISADPEWVQRILAATRRGSPPDRSVAPRST